MIDQPARTLAAGDLRAVFLPGLGMLGASLRYRGEELLGRVDDIEACALAGRTCGIPLLYPWANRLGGPRYQAAGREVLLDPASSLLHFTEDGLPMHCVPWSRLSWQVIGEDTNTLKAQLEWISDDLLAVFPFPHRLEMTVALHPNNLTVETTLVAGPSGPVPVSFGFPLLEAMRRASTLLLEAHLMIVQPDRYLDEFAQAGADVIIVHQEATVHLDRSIHYIKQLGKKAGVAICPATPVHMLEDVIEDLDLVLVMKPRHGYGGSPELLMREELVGLP